MLNFVIILSFLLDFSTLLPLNLELLKKLLDFGTVEPLGSHISYARLVARVCHYIEKSATSEEVGVSGLP